eukprot:s2248_g12.t1
MWARRLGRATPALAACGCLGLSRSAYVPNFGRTVTTLLREEFAAKRHPHPPSLWAPTMCFAQLMRLNGRSNRVWMPMATPIGL